MSIRLMLEGENEVTVSPDRITAVLEANRDVKNINLVDCSAEQLLNFILEIQKNTKEQQLTSPTDIK